MTSNPIPTLTRTWRSVAITGSKGGVGKSNLSVNLALSLQRAGRRVVLVDGDLGLANIDVLLGLAPPRTVEHLVRGEAVVDELLVDGPGGIRILPAASGVPRLTRMEPETRRRVLEALTRSEALADHVLVDTGAGLNETALALQLSASRVIVVTTTEPTSLVDAYASIKVLWDAEPAKPIDLVVNNVGSVEEAEGAYKQIATACRHFLQREPGWLGSVCSDPKIPGAVRQQRALLDLYPTSPAARCYDRIALKLAAQSDSVPGYAFWEELASNNLEEICH